VLLGVVHLGGVSRSGRLVRRARDERARCLAQTHEEETPRHVAEERLRIARALDSVTHNLASIAVQADADDTGAGGGQPTVLGYRPGPRSGPHVRGVLPLRPPRHWLCPTTSTEEPP
jgi:hypothetical protein